MSSFSWTRGYMSRNKTPLVGWPPLLRRSGYAKVKKAVRGSNSRNKITHGVDYSYLKASTGFLVAALQLCQFTVINAIPNAIIPANKNIHQLSSVL
jgi:hypothetical protein